MWVRWKMDFEDVACVLHGLAEMVTLWEMTAWEEVGFLRVGFSWNDQGQSSPLSKGSLLEFCRGCGQCILWGVRDWNVWRAGETTKAKGNDSSGLGGQPRVCVSCAGSALWQLMIRAVHTQPGKPRGCDSSEHLGWGSSSCAYSQRDLNFSWPVWEFLTGHYCTQSWYFNTCLESCVWKMLISALLLMLISALLLTTKPAPSFSQFQQNLEIKIHVYFPNKIATPVVQPTGHLT